LRAYQARIDDLGALGATLVAVSPQTPDNSVTAAEKWELGFEVLSDGGNRVARLFGLPFRFPDYLVSLYEQAQLVIPEVNGVEGWELPVPATYVLDRASVIRLAFVDVDYRRRLEPDEIIATLRAL
jgi:peroxiredoxin